MADAKLRNEDGQRLGSTSRIRAVSARIAAFLRSLADAGHHSWLIVAMLVTGAILHYANPLPTYDESNSLHLTKYGMDRVFLMIPVVYAGFILGPRGGFVTLVIVTLIMLPRAAAMSSNPLDSFLEVSGILLVSGLIILWFRGQREEKERRLEVLKRLEMARQEMALQIEVITKNERRLATINQVCSVVTQSLDLPHILQQILDKVVEEMGG